MSAEPLPFKTALFMILFGCALAVGCYAFIIGVAVLADVCGPLNLGNFPYVCASH